MKKSLIIIILILLVSCSYSSTEGVSTFSAVTIDDTSEIVEENISSSYSIDNDAVIVLYEEFLQGKRGVMDKDTILYISDILYIDRNSTEDVDYEYAFYDINGDDIVELHVMGPTQYTVIFYDQQELKLWKMFSLYSKPTNGKGFLYHRSGGAPPHHTYQYEIFDFFGNQTFLISFEKYDADMNGVYDENDYYLYDRVEVSKEVWDGLTRRYFSLETNMIKWNKAEYSIMQQ